MELNEAIAVELLRRDGEVERTAQADNQDGSQAQNNQSALRYPLRFAVDVALIERNYLAKDLGVRKPTVMDKLKADIVKNYATNNIAQATLRQDQLDRKLALERVKRCNKKALKRAIKEYRD